MATTYSWMLAGYQQNDTNGRHGLQWLHTRGLGSHRYFSDIYDQDIGSWWSVYQSHDSSFDNSAGKYYCRSKGVVFSTVTLMFTNPNTRDTHVELRVNGIRYSLSNDHCGGGSGNGHTWNGMTTSLVMPVNDGDYISCRCQAASGFTSGTRGYLYGGNNNYNNWQIFYLPGAQLNV